MQRSPTLVVNVEPSAQLPYALYDEAPSLEDCDLITMSVPIPLAKESHVMLTEQAKKLDQKLLDALTGKGFKLDFDDDGTGWQFKATCSAARHSPDCGSLPEASRNAGFIRR